MPTPESTPEEYVKDNDYTLSVSRTQKQVLEDGSYYPLKTVSSITRTFNFLSQQVTTTTRDYVYQMAAHNYGGSSGVSATTTVQNFDDLQSPAELTRMHARLTAFGGHPPALDEILRPERLEKAKLPRPSGGL